MGAIAIQWLDAIVRELTLFAAVGFLVGGIDDLLIDVVWLFHRLRHGSTRRSLANLPHPEDARRLAVFVPAWDESAVIGPMLRTALARFDHPCFRIYVGCYPNDPATIDIVAELAAQDSRVRLVIGGRAGPTTKADNLNEMWRALRHDDAVNGENTVAVVLHDAEDVVHPLELMVFDALIGRYHLIQIPVLPLVDRQARLVSGHYADEFAESHGRHMALRAALGAGLPLSGVGCAISVAVLVALDEAYGAPFDEDSLTEDYELGLRAAALGYRPCFARVEDWAGRLVAVRAFFPATVEAAVRQKGRWMTGIALAGWDRIGWARVPHLVDHWMRMRDRRGPLAVIVLAAAYLAIVGWGVAAGAHAIAGVPLRAISDPMQLLLMINLLLLIWRLGWRVASTTRSYGWREGIWAVPRAVVANIIAMLAAIRAAGQYVRMLTGSPPRWDKTAHVFPAELAA
ncbi:glycosyl transferase family protein [Sphingomonas sp.]|jgi:adsorption protein B|uniref:glycosyl transferase family protein n=1 Tax=Sphingomonas sp. TaxID=28214 RepID=UPI0026155026|nr:glycosyl transferase family protein [Sphingomonas sp.]MDF2493668.1 glycosyl transferase family protein [Sphingomonas sp.]